MATRFRLQFNLRTSLLLISVIALATFGYAQSYRNREQAKRIQELEEQLTAARERELVKQQELIDAVSTPKDWFSEIPRNNLKPPSRAARRVR